MHTTNYSNTFIEVADDCRAEFGASPPEKQVPTIASLQYKRLLDQPYTYTSDELLFEIYALRNSIPEAEQAAKRAEFFAKGQACLRASPLAKTYGWGIHFDADARVAIYAKGSEDYERLRNDSTLTQLKAMRSAR